MASVQNGAEILTLSHVDVSFGSHLVLRDLNWRWQAGESVLIVGASGAGKSTLAMLTSGLIPGSVDARLSGSLWRHPGMDQAGAVGYVFQDADSQFCQIRVGEEVAFGLENRCVDPQKMDPLIVQALRESGLKVPLDLEHMILSGGNKQKLAIACALALNPQVLILDEPTANLDPASTDDVFADIIRFVDQGSTVMVIEHKFEALAPHLPYVLLLDKEGRIYRFGRSAEVLSRERQWLLDQGLVRSSPRPRPGVGARNQAVVLEMQSVGARYGSKAPLVLDQVNLEIRGGELVALLGANGAGKSTLLKMMAGLMRPSSGLVRRSGSVAFGFQNPEHQFIFERVVDELANRYVGSEVPEAVHERLIQFDLQDQKDKSPYALSQGQKRRLSVAVMLELEHALYCLDEPTFGQDAKTRTVIMERLRERQRRGAAVVISTHDVALVQEWADRVVVIDGGRVVFDGVWPELALRPDLLRRARLMAGEERGDQVQAPPRFQTPNERVRSSPMGQLNPGWKLLSIFIAVGLTAFAHRLAQAALLAMIPLVLLTLLSGLEILRVIKRLAPFVIFFAVYVWTLTAYAHVSKTTPTIHVLWYHLSYPGFIDGVVLGLRMLSAVGFGLLLVSTVDLVQLVKSLSREFHIPPRFSYGTLAGLRFFPLFQEEWAKLRLARKVRGRDARWSGTRVVTYALPLLSDAVRLSERVAIAMEARGFTGRVARFAHARTYYHPSPRSWRDLVFGVTIVAAAALALWH
ncbi:MAG: ABC transporter ATP-binding protein [Sulfobacillus acidophilus]|uniref:ABC transporter ATP-binding protein n=1 Tax=Sulfobacillus acidophilus TaxID=53633 RepID=A0A2T2WPP4_9FIRM|nr:MAG: ABC transporter ATP-binding protein [Sulfobacillus acidophilus]